MSHLIDDLKALDDRIVELFQLDQVDSEEVLLLIDEREYILQEIFLQFKSVPELIHSKDWQDAILRTKYIVELVQSETSQVGEQLKKYRHGNKSVQRYQQFL